MPGRRFQPSTSARLSGSIEREAAEDGEAVGMGARRLDRQLVGVRVPARRVQHGPVDAGRIHVAQRLVGQIGRRAVRRQRRALAPQVHLRIDDRHGRFPGFFSAIIAAIARIGYGHPARREVRASSRESPGLPPLSQLADDAGREEVDAQHEQHAEPQQPAVGMQQLGSSGNASVALAAAPISFCR